MVHPIVSYFYYFSNLNNLNCLGQTPWICNMMNWLSNTTESRLMDVYICDNSRLLLNDCVTNNKPPRLETWEKFILGFVIFYGLILHITPPTLPQYSFAHVCIFVKKQITVDVSGSKEYFCLFILMHY